MMIPTEQHGAPRILLLAPNWLGDVVMTTPLISLLSRARFGARDVRADIILAVRRAWLPLFEADPRVAAIFPVERSGRHGGFAGIWRQARDLGRQKGDAIILGPPSLRAGLVSRLAGIPQRFGYRTDGRGLFLNAGLDFPGRGHGHYSDQLADLGRALLARLQGRVADSVGAATGPLLPGCARQAMPGWDEGPPVWALGVGATYGGAKAWPRAKVLEFLALVVNRHRVRLVLLGAGPAYLGDSPDGLAVRRELAGDAGIVDLVGRTSLPQVCDLLARSRVFVGNDSGLMHLAAAMATPTVGLFGSSDPNWTAPLGNRTRVLKPEGFACSPCFRPECNQAQFCLDALAADGVLLAVEDLLECRTQPTGKERTT